MGSMPGRCEMSLWDSPLRDNLCAEVQGVAVADTVAFPSGVLILLLSVVSNYRN